MFSLPSLVPLTPLGGTSLTPAREESVPPYFAQGYSIKTFPLLPEVPPGPEVFLFLIPPELLPSNTANSREVVVEVAPPPPSKPPRKEKKAKIPRLSKEQYRDYFRSLPSIPRGEAFDEASQGLSLPLPLQRGSFRGNQ